MMRGSNVVSLSVANSEGADNALESVYVNYEGSINNFHPGDLAYTYDLGDGFGSFPGSNKLKHTEYA